MSTPFTHKPLLEVKDSAPDLGVGSGHELRFAKDDLNATGTGVTHHRLEGGTRQAFGHSHEQAEEIYVVLSGSGKMKLNDEIIELGSLDAVRVSPAVMRSFEAGPWGMDVLAFGTRHDGDGELAPGWWSE